MAQSTLKTTVNWRFSPENLRRAHDAVVARPGQLPVSRLFRRAPGRTPTSSDGQKYYVAVDSIHAACSHKYFGQEMRFKHLGKASALTGSGMTGTGSFTRPRSRPLRGEPLPWSTDSSIMRWWRPPFTAPTRTALLRATSPCRTGLKEPSPRAFNPFRTSNSTPSPAWRCPTRRAYALWLGKALDRGLIGAQWETILRRIVSLGQKHVTAAIVLRRLHSYSQHHPLYLALREVGRAGRTEFLLRCMDDQGLRKRIDDQPDKLDSPHSFARAVFYGQNGQFRYAGKEAQQPADACKRLVQNVLVGGNCCCLTQQLFQAPANERPALADAIARMPPLSWPHLNLHGGFDFSDEALTPALQFDSGALLTVAWETANPTQPTYHLYQTFNQGHPPDASPFGGVWSV